MRQVEVVTGPDLSWDSVAWNWCIIKVLIFPGSYDFSGSCHHFVNSSGDRSNLFFFPVAIIFLEFQAFVKCISTCPGKLICFFLWFAD
jgi:hypothetical protein